MMARRLLVLPVRLTAPKLSDFNKNHVSVALHLIDYLILSSASTQSSGILTAMLSAECLSPSTARTPISLALTFRFFVRIAELSLLKRFMIRIEDRGIYKICCVVHSFYGNYLCASP
ncbi:MAG: hypothetical protein F4010_01690 [Cenarchaeum sp. SB0669_bin_11]|nr:hypothetical protein [Cenarchaeum sp. SB0669_bin_11]